MVVKGVDLTMLLQEPAAFIMRQRQLVEEKPITSQ